MTDIVGAVLRDYLLGTTHRKDLLQGALWQKLRDQLVAREGRPVVESGRILHSLHEGPGLALPLGPPPSDGRFGAAAPGTALGTILCHVAGIMRWEPVNPNPEHRACPSPGNRFTVDMEIACRGNDGVRWFRYLPREQALARIGDRDDVYIADARDVIVALRADLRRCAVPYGDLAYCLATVELGAMLAQLALVLGTAELGAKTVRSASHGIAGGPAVVAHICAPAIAEWLGHARTHPMRLVDSIQLGPDEVGGGLLRGLRNLASLDAPAPDLFPQGLSADSCRSQGLFRATSVRSSGLDLHGTSEGRPDVTQLTAMLEAVRTLHASFTGLAALPVRVDVWIDTPAGQMEADDYDSSFPPWLHLARITSPNRSPGYAHPVGAVIITVSADLADYTARLGAGTVFAMHLAAGIATQIIGIAAAAVGLVCRPMRSFDHAAVDAALPIEYWSLIQLVVYDDRTPNPAFAVPDTSWAKRS